jgi:Protein of unknown function (DUF2917)
LTHPARFTTFHTRFIALAGRAQDTGFTPAGIAGFDQPETDMTANFDQARVELDQALFLRLAHAQGATVICLEGCLWITRDGYPDDIQLAPGQRYQVEEDASLVIVSGFEPSLARVLRPAATCRPVVRRLLAAFLPPRGRSLALS